MVQFVREFNACGLSSYSAPGIRLGFLDTKVGKKKKKKRDSLHAHGAHRPAGKADTRVMMPQGNVTSLPGLEGT